jgi:hypothetical protein
LKEFWIGENGETNTQKMLAVNLMEKDKLGEKDVDKRELLKWILGNCFCGK